MNLFQLIHTIKNTAGKSNLVSSVKDGDVYENLNSGTQTYPVVNVTIDNITKDETGTSSVTMNIFYIDRLEDNNRNKTQVQSSAVTVLEQIMNKLEDEQAFDFTSKTFYPFTEKFADICAGSYVTCTLDLQLDTLCDNESFEHKTLNIQSNGLYDVAGYDEANVDISAAGAIDYYWIMPHNYGAPSQITYSDINTTLEIKFRLKSTAKQSIYDDGYTSLIYEDNQYKARLNGGEWKDTFIREPDIPEAKTVKLTGTKLQIGYYLFDLEDGGHKWSYGQRMYIGKGENVGDIDVYYCKLYWDKGDFADYEPFIENGETVLKDAVGGTVLSIKKDTFENHLNDVEQYLVTYVTDTKMVPTDNFKIKCKLRPYFPSKISNYSYFFLVPNENDKVNSGSIWMYNNSKLGCAMNGSDKYLSNNTFAQGDILEFELNYGKTASTCTLWVNGEQRSVNTYPKYRQITKSIMLGGSSFDTANYTYWYSLQMYDNDVLVFDAKPKRIGNTNNYILYDEISKRVVSTFIDDFNKLSENSTLQLEYDEPSDFQTLTLSNEEYKTVKPLLAKIRGEEIVDDEQRAVVD